MTRPNEPSADLQRWACDQLGMSDGTRPDRAALLRRLADESFAPPPAVDYAIRLLGGTPDTTNTDPASWEAQRDLENRCREEVEEFAANCFILPVRTRQRRWQELTARCAPFVALTARLDALEPGLEVDPNELDGPAAQFAIMVCELFVLRPGPRAARRRQLLEELHEEQGIWESAARDLKRLAPRLARLEPVFLGALIDKELHREQARRAKKSRGKSRASLSSSATGRGGGGWGWAAYLVILAILGAIRAASGPSTSSNPDHSKPPAIPMFRFEVKEGAGPFGEATQRLLKEEFEQLKKQGWVVKDGKLTRIVDPKAKPEALVPDRKPDSDRRDKPVGAGKK